MTLKTKEQEFLSRIEQHKGILYKVSKMYMDNRDDQEDLFQEIICQLWKANDSFKGESQFSTWMYRVAINTAIVFLKKEKKKVDKYELSSTNIPDEEGDADIKERQLEHFYRAVQKYASNLLFQSLFHYLLIGFAYFFPALIGLFLFYPHDCEKLHSE